MRITSSVCVTMVASSDYFQPHDSHGRTLYLTFTYLDGTEPNEKKKNRRKENSRKFLTLLTLSVWYSDIMKLILGHTHFIFRTYNIFAEAILLVNEHR